MKPEEKLDRIILLECDRYSHKQRNYAEYNKKNPHKHETEYRYSYLFDH